PRCEVGWFPHSGWAARPIASFVTHLEERMISVRGLSKRYGGTPAVGGLSFEVRPGVVTGFLGPDGAGKSTTMRLILGLDEPVNGLDPEGIRWIRTLMKSLAAQGRTVFVSSHLISEIALTADHLIVIGGGRLLADTSVAELTARSESLEEAFLELTGASA